MYRYYITQKTDFGIPNFPPIPVPKDIFCEPDLPLGVGYVVYDEKLSENVISKYNLIQEENLK